MRTDLKMPTLEVRFPWPSSALSPNTTHAHWSSLRRAQKRYRQACYTEALIAGATKRRWPSSGNLLVTLTFLPPAAHRYDADNLVARMKAGLDGLARALGVDDHRFRLAAPVIGDTGRPGSVVVLVESLP